LGSDQFDAVTDFDAASASDGCVQTELSAEPANNIAQNLGILCARVGIVGRHDATAAEVSKTDLRFGQPQNRTRPLSLGGPSNTADHEVRPQAPDVAAEHRYRAVGADEQRQDVETFRAIESLQSCAGPHRRLDQLRDLMRAPW